MIGFGIWLGSFVDGLMFNIQKVWKGYGYNTREMQHSRQSFGRLQMVWFCCLGGVMMAWFCHSGDIEMVWFGDDAIVWRSPREM